MNGRMIEWGQGRTYTTKVLSSRQQYPQEVSNALPERCVLNSGLVKNGNTASRREGAERVLILASFVFCLDRLEPSCHA
jgi:hypothetical protein